jgi:glycine/D-amino acid oxidase-like deaminating enzyme
LPIVGRLPDRPWLYHVVTHSGVTLAPLLGRLVAHEILRDDEAALLDPYRPARFVA